MKKYLFNKACFKTTATCAKHYPTLRTSSGMLMPEIAVAGRSNVGKSSLLNHLFHARGLVKTSSTPGKTQAINFFTVDEELAFVDLPGYGYAEVPIAMRKKWGPMVQEYLQERKHLKLVLFLFDIRRLPKEDDKEFMEWIAHYEKSMILVLTKTDKVTKNEKAAQTKKILAAFGAENVQWIHYSTQENVGHKQLPFAINEAMRESLMDEADADLNDSNDGKQGYRDVSDE